ncbi:uncharacterized protein LOC134688362 [Mytilus trossulus]|uniref:uncharacterized protein LOC134688362 n=1 Tax=Mytilus trossulus TaxID=6551 RepID=UPI003006540F
MTTNTIFITPDADNDIELELKAEITEIYTASVNTPVINVDLEDNQKRWLLIGICLQNIVSPTLRNYVEPVVQSHYNAMKHSHRIHTQNYPNHQKKDLTSGTKLNYEAINKNNYIPKIGWKQDLINYDYSVRNHVEFSKLFMKTYMAQYSAFDQTCDLSALLSLIVKIDKFPQPARNVATTLRSDVRNSWAHCNFDEWDTLKYQTSFQLMHQLIKCLNLNTPDETKVLADITKWEQNGFMFLQGYSVTQTVLNEFRHQTRVLAEYALKLESGKDRSFMKIHETMLKINGEMERVCRRIDTIENVQTENRQDIDGAITYIVENTQNVNSLKTESKSTINRVKTLEYEAKSTTEDVSNIKKDITEMKENIGDFKNYMCGSKPTGKIFFFPPNRSESFVARGNEINKIKNSFVNKNTEHHTLVISGLGGCGKTTLATEFAWRYHEFYQGGVFWMSAESESSLEDSITTLAIDVSTTGKDFRETFRRTLKWFFNLTERWLLVVDNTDEEYLSDYTKELLVGSWKRNTRGHIIVTTRRDSNEIEESMHVKLENCISLGVFETTEALEFVKQRTGRVDSSEDHAILTLIEELGSLPLALEQAAAHVKSIQCSFDDYVKRFGKKRIKLLRSAPSPRKVGKDRLTVATTWQLNIEYISRESERENLGTAAITVMEIASFLFADKIPQELFNVGNPVIEDTDLTEALDDEVGRSQIIEILSRFSLFQFMKDKSLSVHRLVQEVIRDNMVSDRRYCILQYALCMVKKALDSCVNPNDVIIVDHRNESARGSLGIWGKLASNANTLKGHLLQFVKNDESKQNICLNDQMLKILQTTAVYHSINQRQALALADQEQMVQIIPTLPVHTKYYHELTSITIPLLKKDRETILECLASVIHNDSKDMGDTTPVPVIPYNSESLREMGNKAYKEHRYYDAIQCYTEGIRSCSKDNIDSRFYSNRSLAYIKICDYEHALNDASSCIQIATDKGKGHYCKAYSVSKLIESGSLPSNMEAIGYASASIAAYKDERCLREHGIRVCYPRLSYKMIEVPEFLSEEIMLLTDRPFTTLILRKGRYIIREPLFTTKSIQVVGIEEGVEIDTGPFFQICVARKLKGHSIDDTHPGNSIHAHFENIKFLKGGCQITVTNNSVATFNKCSFSNGQIGCEYFPKCKGEEGCINRLKCKADYQSSFSMSFANKSIGEVGYAGVCVSNGGTAYVDSCLFDRCGGGGVLSCGNGSLIEIRSCTISNMRQMGVEARDGGAIKAINNTIYRNQSHGIAIGPNGYGYISGNLIEENGAEGVWSGGILDRHGSVNLNEKDSSRAVLLDNIIRQNGLSGISFDGGYFEVKGNLIHSNWLWGMMVKSRSYSYIQNNEICENKCGGIRIGHNYTAAVFIDGNTIRDHTGPGIYTVNSIHNLFGQSQKKKTLIRNIKKIPVADGELLEESRKPFISSINVFQNNEQTIQHPTDIFCSIKACCFCHKISQQLESCPKCMKAKYCSKDCQTKHLIKHKHMCTLLTESFVVEVQMCDTEPNNLGQPPEHREAYNINLRTFHPNLVGIRKGTPPDKSSSTKFKVKIQTGREYGYYDPFKKLVVYDQTVTLDIQFSNPKLYHLCNECGVLAGQKLTVKKIFCWASFKNNGKTICFHTENLPPFQTW